MIERHDRQGERADSDEFRHAFLLKRSHHHVRARHHGALQHFREGRRFGRFHQKHLGGFAARLTGGEEPVSDDLGGGRKGRAVGGHHQRDRQVVRFFGQQGRDRRRSGDVFGGFGRRFERIGRGGRRIGGIPLVGTCFEGIISTCNGRSNRFRKDDRADRRDQTCGNKSTKGEHGFFIGTVARQYVDDGGWGGRAGVPRGGALRGGVAHRQHGRHHATCLVGSLPC